MAVCNRPDPAIRQARPAGWQPGPVGHLACLLFTVVLALVTTGGRLLVAAGVAFAVMALWQGAGLKALANRRLGAMLLVLVASAAWITVARRAPDSPAGLWQVPAELGLRALLLASAMLGFSRALSISDVSGLLERAGLREVGFAAGVAVNMLPLVAETASDAYQALRLRGGFRRRRLRAVRLLLVTVIANSLAYADDISGAAEARAYRPHDRGRRPPPVARRGDGLLATVLSLTALGILALGR